MAADNTGYTELQELLSLAQAAGIGDRIQIDCSVVRGLSYYTGTVWECFDASGKMPRAVAGGGRYDNLLEHLGGEAALMVGFGFGDVVILDILAERKLLPDDDKGIDDVVYPMSAAEFAAATSLAQQLRAEGRKVAIDYSCRRFKHVVLRAEGDGAERLLILGAKEVERGIYKARDLSSREEVEQPLPAV